MSNIHSEKCRTSVVCSVCNYRKAPIGRSVPIEMGNSLCNSDCEGYRKDPYPPHLWPNEEIPYEEESE